MLHLTECNMNCTIYITAQKLKFPIKDFFSKCDQIRSILNGKLHFLCSVVECYLFMYKIKPCILFLFKQFRWSYPKLQVIH